MADPVPVMSNYDIYRMRYGQGGKHVHYLLWLARKWSEYNAIHDWAVTAVFNEYTPEEERIHVLREDFHFHLINKVI